MGHLSWAERRRRGRVYEVRSWYFDKKRDTYDCVTEADELTLKEAEKLMRKIPLDSDLPQVDLFYDDGDDRYKVAYRETYCDGNAPYEEWLI